MQDMEQLKKNSKRKFFSWRYLSQSHELKAELVGGKNVNQNAKKKHTKQHKRW